jgi:hypothetical protein
LRLALYDLQKYFPIIEGYRKSCTFRESPVGTPTPSISGYKTRHKDLTNMKQRMVSFSATITVNC